MPKVSAALGRGVGRCTVATALEELKLAGMARKVAGRKAGSCAPVRIGQPGPVVPANVPNV